MKRILYYDVFCGISGDMHLGALLDLGVPQAYLEETLKCLPLDGEYAISVGRGTKMGITGTKVDVVLTAREDDHHHHHGHGHHHDHHAHNHEGHQEQDHDHRDFASIRAMIEASSLSLAIKTRAIAIFEALAIAEGKVHGKPPESVHFHEVGAVDSIVDIVGAAICLDYLNVDMIWASPVQVGGGMVRCAHGLMPVPAPATAELLKDVPIKMGLVQSESTTPTGAAILRVNVGKYTSEMDFQITKIGYGLGTKDFPVPNVLRVYLGEVSDALASVDEVQTEGQYLLEANLDDMSPEHASYLGQLLFDAGALDVYTTPIHMKKNRSAVILSVLCDRDHREKLAEVLFVHSSTAGFRETAVTKYMLKRVMWRVVTAFGEVAVKALYYRGKVVKWKAEHDDCARLARAHGVTLLAVEDAVRLGVSALDRDGGGLADGNA